MNKKPIKNYGEFDNAPHNYVADILDNPDDVASANGATGMIPTPPLSAAEAESYNDLYAVPQQVDDLYPPRTGSTGAKKQ